MVCVYPCKDVARYAHTWLVRGCGCWAPLGIQLCILDNGLAEDQVVYLFQGMDTSPVVYILEYIKGPECVGPVSIYIHGKISSVGIYIKVEKTTVMWFEHIYTVLYKCVCDYCTRIYNQASVEK